MLVVNELLFPFSMLIFSKGHNLVASYKFTQLFQPTVSTEMQLINDLIFQDGISWRMFQQGINLDEAKFQ